MSAKTERCWPQAVKQCTRFARYEIIYLANCEIESLRFLWNKINPLSHAAGVFHIVKTIFHARRVFHKSWKDLFRWKKHLRLQVLFSGGGRWIRTIESIANRFTVCPLWPLGNPPWSWWWDSNPQPADYKSAALPIELHQHINFFYKAAHLLQHAALHLVGTIGLEPMTLCL